MFFVNTSYPIINYIQQKSYYGERCHHCSSLEENISKKLKLKLIFYVRPPDWDEGLIQMIQICYSINNKEIFQTFNAFIFFSSTNLLRVLTSTKLPNTKAPLKIPLKRTQRKEIIFFFLFIKMCGR